MKRYVWAILIFLVLTLVMTFPLVFKATTHIPGFFSSDENFAPLWDSWRIKYSFSYNLPLGRTDLIAYPFTIDLYSSGYFSYIWLGLTYLLSILTTKILTYNIQVIINLLLSGIFSYLLVYYLTKSTFCAMFGGIIFIFCPYQFTKIWQHLGLTYNQWIPLLILSAIMLNDHSSAKRKYALFISMLLLFSFDWSIMYMASVALFILLIYILFYRWKEKLSNRKSLLRQDLLYFRTVFIISLAAFAIFLPQFFTAIKNRIIFAPGDATSVFSIYRRPFEDLFTQSAKPLTYFLPPHTHPIFGKFTESFMGSSLYGVSFTEHTLYLGWVPLILAFVAVRRWRLVRKQQKQGLSPLGAVPAKLGTVPLGGSVNSSSGDSPYKENFYIGFFIFLAVVAWFFSQPPWWKFGSIKIYMPSFFMYKILPMFRAYCRFGIVVMLAVAVLSGFGLKFILERFKTQKAKVAITSLFCGLLLFEFWNWPPFKVIDVSKVSAVYYWLKEQPGDFVIAEYPLDADSPNEMYKFYQTVHEKRIINGTIPGTYANKVAQTITKLSEAKSIDILKQMGVRYILVHHQGYLQTDLIEDREELEKIPKNAKLKFIRSFPSQECPKKDIMCVQKTGPIDIYEIF